MPLTTVPRVWPRDKMDLYFLGIAHVAAFCDRNEIEPPKISSADSWMFDTCAYYRASEGIRVCVPKCQVPCAESNSRNWTWPGNATDREPFGVIAHELGHHIDTVWGAEVGADVGRYWSRNSTTIRQESGEARLTSYCPNDGEWFAEMFRVFVTNPALLLRLRPKTYQLLTKRWKPYGPKDWRTNLGTNVPARVVKSLINKGAP